MLSYLESLWRGREEAYNRCAICKELHHISQFRAPSGWGDKPRCFACLKSKQDGEDNSGNLIVDHSDMKRAYLLKVLKKAIPMLPEELLHLVMEMEWRDMAWDTEKKAADIMLLYPRIALKQTGNPGLVRVSKPLSQGWTYFELVFYNIPILATHPRHLNRHFIGVVESNVENFSEGLAQVRPGYWGINESPNGWWFHNGEGSRAPGMVSFLSSHQCVCGLLVSTELNSMWFFLNDRLNGEPLVGLPNSPLYPAVLLRDHNSLAKLMFPRVYPNAVAELIEKHD